jgi:hypothetical protein
MNCPEAPKPDIPLTKEPARREKRKKKTKCDIIKVAGLKIVKEPVVFTFD